MKTILAISACILTFAAFAGTRQLGEIRANDYVVTNEDDLAAIAYTTAVSNKLEIGKQKKLVSGTNIKTVNGQSLLGSGNIVIEGGGGGGGADTNAVHYATDVNGNNTAVGIGSRLSGSAIGKFSVVEGEDNSASGECSHAEGVENVASGYASHAEGGANTASGDNSHAGGILAKATNDVSYVWNGSYVSGPFEYYGSHGYGTYNISPFGGARGLWIGDTNLETHILNAASSTSVTNGGAKAYADYVGATTLASAMNSAKAYADATFLKNSGGNVSGDIVFTSGLDGHVWRYSEGANEYEYEIKPSTYPFTYKGFELRKTKNPRSVPGREDMYSNLFIDGTDFATLASTTNVVNGMIGRCVKHSYMWRSMYVMTNEIAFSVYPLTYRPVILSKEGINLDIDVHREGGSATNNTGITFSGVGTASIGAYRLSCDDNGIGFVTKYYRSKIHDYLTSYLVPDGTPVATSNMVERVIASKPAPSPLTGKTYDFANGSNFTMRVYTALTNVIHTLGGTVANPPAFN